MARLRLIVVATTLFLVPFAARAESVIDSSGLRTTAQEALGEANVTDTASDLPTFIGTFIIRPILGLVGLGFFLMMLYGGVLWLTSGGNGDQVKRARDIIVNGVIGVAIVVAAYAITTAIFNALTTGSITYS